MPLIFPIKVYRDGLLCVHIPASSLGFGLRVACVTSITTHVYNASVSLESLPWLFTGKCCPMPALRWPAFMNVPFSTGHVKRCTRWFVFCTPDCAEPVSEADLGRGLATCLYLSHLLFC